MADGRERKSGPEWTVRVPREAGRLRRETAFLCNIRFKNDLPEIPCDPKLLLPPYNKEEIAAFKLTELEKDLKKDVLFEPDLGIPLHAWNIERYSIPEGPPQPLHPDDAALLESDEELEPKRARLRGEAAEVSWLLRTKYIAAEAGLKRGIGAQRKAAAAAAAPEEEGGEESKEGRLRQIEAQFLAARAPLVHCKDPSLRPLEVLPVFPDSLMEGRHCVLATFDADPLQDVESVEQLPPEQRARMAQAAQLKSFRLANGKQFVALVVPERPPPESEEGGGEGTVPAATFAQEHQWVREYNFHARVDHTGSILMFRFAADGTVQFHPFNAKLDLRKRKRQAAAGGDEEETDSFVQPEKIIIRLPGSLEEEEAEEEEEEAQRQQDGAAAGGSEDAQQQEQQEWGSEEGGGGGGGSGGAGAGGGGSGDVDMADAEGGGGGKGDDYGGRADANAALRDVFGSDDDDI